MKAYKNTLLSLLFISSFSLLASENIDSSDKKSYTEKELRTIVNQSIRLLNYETREKELILEPLKLTKEDVVKFLPPLKESGLIYDMYIESGFNVIESIKYTHMDIIEIYKDHIVEDEK